MASVPKQWVMKPLTPKLEKSDFRTLLSPGSEQYSLEKSWNLSQNGDSHSFNFDNISVSQYSERVMNGEGFGDVVRARQVAFSEGSSTSEDWRPSTPNSPGSASSIDSHVGFYSFVDDPTSPEAEMNEVYMVSPKRQAKLSTLKEKSRFKLQTYMEERRPEKLFQETNGNNRYHVVDISGKDNDEERPDRMAIIRSQAPKRSTVFKEEWSALESLDLTNSPQRLVEGFSLCYSPVSTKPLQSEAEPGTIDNQQIDFNAARKQFQMMERTKQNPFWKSSQQATLSPQLRERSLSAGAKLFTKDVSKTETLKDDSGKRQEYEAIKEDLEARIQTSLIDKVDLGLDNQDVGSTSVGHLSTEPSMLDNTSVASMSETPIEREIRIAQEREQDLRRSRGIFFPDTSEMVEIKTKPILSLPTPQIKPIKAKESNRMSLLIQREIERVNQNPGLYDRGSLHNQGERKRTFGSLSDQLDIIPSSTSPSINPMGRSIITEDTSITENPVQVEQREVFDSKESLSPCCPHRHPDDTVIWRESIGKIPDRTFGTSPYTKEWAEKENSKTKTANQPFWMADYKPKESRRTFTTTYPLSFPSEPLSSSRSTGAWRSLSESSNEWPRMLNAPDIIRKEIEESLRREQELQELRETSNLSGASEPPLPSSITSDEVSGQNNNDKTPINSSYDNLVVVEAVLPQKSTQRTSYSSSNSWNVDPTPVTCTSVPGPRSRLSSIMTAQPWTGPKHTTPAVHKAVPALPSSPLTETSSHRGLTKTLLDDFEERRVRLKLEESSYAGIQPVDEINNEVVEVTRVTRHKNTRALRWEAGVYANEEDN
ncbi:mitotic interactor and substrate of PLK1 isoform X2 [Pangasianodon hypophthalmus]|nr:mitotic interactor and substrate of PLK1 isoform X2 [Pangasianodon hypophthalmus]XP_026776872.3 mitotic interactor and substrate of PLK1 isoform X2 [Pangasianodon hypophthalmus]XP_026776876.3 mitotic interactor and substrate of PLK1 isoform X2 [Pangasianodon hypophthalmus]